MYTYRTVHEYPIRVRVFSYKPSEEDAPSYRIDLANMHEISTIATKYRTVRKYSIVG